MVASHQVFLLMINVDFFYVLFRQDFVIYILVLGFVNTRRLCYLCCLEVKLYRCRLLGHLVELGF